MPISVTCECGSRLEIDEKFLGKEIPCPDCQRPLPTKPPPTPPPLELLDNRRVSGLAVLSLTLAMVGAFSIVGTLAAVAVGLFALREIAKRPHRFEGVGLARAGIITGAVMTFITLVMLISPTVLGLDLFLREFKYAGRVNWPKIKQIEAAGINEPVTMDRPGERWESWGGYITQSNHTQNVLPDDLIMVNVAEDAYIAGQHIFPDAADKADEKKAKVLERFKKSELVNLVGGLDGRPLDANWTIVDDKKEDEIILDVRLGRHERRVLIQYVKDRTKLNMNVACARKSQFDRLEPDFRLAFKSRK